jgi:predicted alpha/beta-fold hydrolase
MKVVVLSDQREPKDLLCTYDLMKVVVLSEQRETKDLICSCDLMKVVVLSDQREPKKLSRKCDSLFFARRFERRGGTNSKEPARHIRQAQCRRRRYKGPELRGRRGISNMKCVQEFTPFGILRNKHAMTIASNFWPRRFAQLCSSVPRLFETEPGTQVRGECHWQEKPSEHPTIVVLHGLEGSCDSGYMLGTAEKAWTAGFNVVRLNQRNCGGTEELTPTLYHSGLSCDIRAVILELIERDGLSEIFAAGFSMGGNLVLKMAGEFGGAAPPELRAVATVAPAFDLKACADALGETENFVYERHFVRRLKSHMRHKASLFPQRYPIDGMREIRSVRDFDGLITARFCGFRDADDYYAQSSAGRVLARVGVPALIVTAQDDPFVPFASFAHPAIHENSNIAFVAPRNGGHCAFISHDGGAARFWAEACVVDFCRGKSELLT